MKALHFIGNDWVAPRSGQTLAVIDPCDGREFARIARGNADDIDAAVTIAEPMNTNAIVIARPRSRYDIGIEQP